MADVSTLPRRRWRLPIRFGYNPHPFWKFEHLRRYDPILTPLLRHRYPVGADVVPPTDIEALARWMDRWRLSPSRMPYAELRDLLQGLAATPVEVIDPGKAPAGDSGDGLRMPAEWEPSEAVITAWPVCYPGLWDFYADLVAAIAPAARVDVLIPDGIFAPAVRAHLIERCQTEPEVRFLVTANDDIWVRDFGPLTCLDRANRRVMVDAIFDPPPQMPFANDDTFPVRYAAHQGVASRHLPLHLEGGNLWSDGGGTIITTEGLFARNPSMTREAVQERLFEGLGAQALIVLPPLRMEDTGHVDVFVKLVAPDTVLVTEPRSIINRERLAKSIEILGASRNAAGDGYRIVSLPSLPHYRNWGFVRVWPNYTNALTVNGRVVVPTYRDPERDAAALAIYRQVLPDHEIVPVDAAVVANAGGAVHCLTMQVPAEVGDARHGRSG